KAHEVRVRCFLVVLEAIAPARGSDPQRQIDAKAPAAYVDHVDAVVAQFAIAPVPEPVPVVVQVIGAERPAWSGALPHVVIEPFGNLACFAAANRGPVVDVPSLGEVGAANGSLADFLDPFNYLGPAAALVAHLHVPFVLAGCLDQQLPFARSVAT